MKLINVADEKFICPLIKLSLDASRYLIFLLDYYLVLTFPYVTRLVARAASSRRKVAGAQVK